jgi:hypothetical protein
MPYYATHQSSVGASLFRSSVEQFRDVVTLMGRSPTHRRLFFKFQSKMSLNMKIALEVQNGMAWHGMGWNRRGAT